LKKLTKILLINWLYFSKQIIEVDDINFLTGNTGSGKTTILDALQIVLLGELNSRNFNKAANDSSQRTLDSYLRADMDDNNPKSRRGKDFSSYIACQFNDDKAGSQFVSGIVFQCRNDGSRRDQFFIYNGVIPEHCFLVDRQAMDIDALRKYLKTLPNANEVFFDSNKGYRDDLLAKWNVHNEQVCRMLKKAVSFKPIDDIQRFITENICDIQEKPDIESMQQNIRDYKRHELLAQRQEEKLKRLVDINRLFREMEAANDRLRIQSFLVLWAQKDTLIQQIEKLSVETRDCTEGIKKSQEKYDNLGSQISDRDRRRNELIADRAKSDIYQEQDRLRGQKDQLQQEQRSLMEQLNTMVLEIKKETQQLHSLCKEIGSWTNMELIVPLQEAAGRLHESCQLFVSCTVEIFSGTTTPFDTAQKTVYDFSACLRNTAYQLGEQMNRLHDELDQNNVVLERLKNNIKDYPRALLMLKTQLEKQLTSKFGRPVSVDILADVLEIAEGEESWRGAIEGYLNTQKFYLLADPEYYAEALLIFDTLKRELGNQSYGLVDIGKLRENETLSPEDNSLAAIIQTDSPLARSYIDYLLGKVIRCTHISQLRKFRTSITAEGMLYHGYVARPLQRHIMDDAFIGRKAVGLRIERLNETVSKLRKDITKLSPIHKLLDSHKNRDFIFSRRFVQEAEQKHENYLRGLEITQELERIEKKLSQLDLVWLSNLDQEINQLEEKLKDLRDEKEKNSNEKTRLENDLKRLGNETLPEKEQQLKEKENQLGEEFSPLYQKTTGIPRYAQELERLKQPAIIAKNFFASQQQIGIEAESAKKRLFQTRIEYVRDFQPCSFRIEVIVNDEFDNEQKLLEESELPKYRDKIKKARESALEQFQNDFLAKLKSSIDQVQEQVKNLNKALEDASFGTDKYRFFVGRNPDYTDYYNMIMDPELMEGNEGLFALPFQQKYGTLIDDLFSRITTSDDTQLNARKQSELQQNIERYTDFRTYLKFDLETTDSNGNKQMLSQTMNTKSGGETQTPFYIAIFASFAQLYRVNDQSNFGNTVRLVIFDEAFNNMDSNRIIESVRLLRKMHLQAIICTPPHKVPDIMPKADCTLYVCKDKYTMEVIPYSKEVIDTWSKT
jgi:hypothetical protein